MRPSNDHLQADTGERASKQDPLTSSQLKSPKFAPCKWCRSLLLLMQCSAAVRMEGKLNQTSRVAAVAPQRSHRRCLRTRESRPCSKSVPLQAFMSTTKLVRGGWNDGEMRGQTSDRRCEVYRTAASRAAPASGQAATTGIGCQWRCTGGESPLVNSTVNATTSANRMSMFHCRGFATSGGRVPLWPRPFVSNRLGNRRVELGQLHHKTDPPQILTLCGLRVPSCGLVT